jgi:hypothetical protein
MSYSPEQRAIAARLGDISRRLHDKVSAQQQAHVDTGRHLIDAVTALTAAMDRSNEIAPIFDEYMNTAAELFDSIANGG